MLILGLNEVVDSANFWKISPVPECLLFTRYR